MHVLHERPILRPTNVPFYVPFYGGTRHSTVRALRKYRTLEEIKKGSMHSTNKAFERYFQIEMDDVRDIYRDTAGDTEVIPKKGQALRPTPLKLQQ